MSTPSERRAEKLRARPAFKKQEGVGVLGKRLKDERIRRNFKIGYFAALSGVDQNIITGAENRGRYPSLKNIIKIAQALECSIDYLCGLED